MTHWPAWTFSSYIVELSSPSIPRWSLAFFWKKKYHYYCSYQRIEHFGKLKQTSVNVSSKISYFSQNNINISSNKLWNLFSFCCLNRVICIWVVSKILCGMKCKINKWVTALNIVIKNFLKQLIDMNKQLAKVKLFGDAAHLRTVVKGHVFKIWRKIQHFNKLLTKFRERFY